MAQHPQSPEKPRLKTIEEVLPSAELLAHYKSRIDQFEQEREELLHAVDRCAVHQDEVHRLEWENRKRADEIKELQKALSDAQQFLFEERQRLLLLQAENDELKLQEIQDRQRIQQLLAMTQPLEQTITYSANGLPSSVTAYPKPQTTRAKSPQRAGDAAAAGVGPAGAKQGQQQRQGTAATAAAAGGGGERVLRTVFLPTVDPDFLLLKIESLQAQLNEQRQLHDERVAALLADRQLRSQEEERQRANLAVQVESLSKQVKQLEDTLRLTTREYIVARREKQDAQAAAAAAQAQMVADVSAARVQLAAAQRQARCEVEKAASTADAKMREYVDKFREQVRSREEELMNLGSLHTATKAAADKRIGELEGRLARLLDANRQLELRRQLDVDGWAADVTRLRQTLAAVDRKLLQMRLIDRLDDDERLDALLDQLEKKIPGPAGTAAAAAPGKRPASAAAAAAGRRPGGGRPGAAAAGGGVGRRQVAASAGAAGRGIRRGAAAAGGAAAAAAAAGGLMGRSRSAGRDQRAAGGLAAAAAAAASGSRSAAGLHGEDSGLGSGGDDYVVNDNDGYDTASSMADSSAAGGGGSVKSGLAAELRAVRQQLEELEARAGNKAQRALAGLPAAVGSSGGSRAAGARRMLA